MGHFVYLMFSLYNRKKKHNFQTDETTEKGKKNLIHLNSHRYFLVYCLHCLNTSKQKWISLHLSNEPKISVWCHSLCTAPCFHDTICKKTITKRCDWCKISKCYDMTGARYIPLCGNLIRARYIPKCGDLNTTLRANVELFLFFPKRKI